MPIPVVCENCQTRLNAPDAAAGRKVKCPKCQAVLPVPGGAAPPPPPPPADLGDNPFGFDTGNAASPPPPPARRPSGESRSAPRPPAPPAESEPAAPAAGGGSFDFGGAMASADPPAGRGRRRRDDDDAPPADDDRPRRRRPRDDDDAPPEGDDDRPRSRGGRDGGKKKGFPVGLVLGILGALLLMCCGGPLGVWFFYIVPKAKEVAQKLDEELKKASEEAKRNAGGGGGLGGGSLPVGWTKFEAPDKSVRAAFPVAFPDDAGLSFTSPTVTSAKGWRSQEADWSLTCTVAVVKFRATSKASDRDAALKLAAGMMSFGGKDAGTPRTVDWLGGQAKETEAKTGTTGDLTLVTRTVVIGNTGYIASVQHKNKPDAVATFFANIEALSK